MMFRKGRTAVQEVESPARVKSMADGELRLWGGNLLMELGRTFDQHTYSKGNSQEVTDVLEAFVSVWAEMVRRET